MLKNGGTFPQRVWRDLRLLGFLAFMTFMNFTFGVVLRTIHRRNIRTGQQFVLDRLNAVAGVPDEKPTRDEKPTA